MEKIIFVSSCFDTLPAEFVGGLSGYCQDGAVALLSLVETIACINS
jgi:hypothetical protein